ncbi:hypothetical protein GLOIN_2v1781059 [Rhizophagus irregularis DAOM 181602=DAOM 197198]|nr:hypothetical protein GLOIN_2v1781059 [Rhizophagus irregularis DAOM 181602=DAOM 197198]
MDYLPEFTYEVIKNFKNDFSTLHSCILVNRLWCRLTIRIYLHNLNDDLKAQLNEYKIDDKLFPSNTLFNYPIFLKYFYTEKIISSIEKWSKDIELENRLIFEFKRLIYMSLFKIFIENEVNIHTFDIEVNSSYEDDMLELILQNPNFLHNIRNLKFNCDDDLFSHTKNLTYQMINLCQNLKKISLAFNNSFLIYQTSLLSKDYNHLSNTLNTIVLYLINFKIITNLDNIFEQLNGLESVHIIYCDLENFACSFGSNLLSEEQQLLEFIIKYCKNIKFLDLAVLNNTQIIYSLLNLTENVKQNLSHLSINIFANSVFSDTIDVNSITLQNLDEFDELKEFELYNIKIQKYKEFRFKFIEELLDFNII